MNLFSSAIFLKTLRDSLWLIAAAAIGLVLFVVLYAWAMLNMGPEVLEFVSKFGFLKKIFEMSLGIKVGEEFSVNIMLAVSFAHAVVMMLSWSVMIAIPTRVTVGESEQGTADLLLTLPVSRTEVFISNSLVWCIAAAILSICPILGIWIGTCIFQPEEAVTLKRFFVPAANFFALLLAIGGISTLVGCLFERRGPAIATAAGIGIGSMMITFVEPFIAQISAVKFLSLMSYFQPVESVRSGAFPVLHILVLAGVGFGSWLVAIVIYNRKDIPTA